MDPQNTPQSAFPAANQPDDLPPPAPAASFPQPTAQPAPLAPIEPVNQPMPEPSDDVVKRQVADRLRSANNVLVTVGAKPSVDELSSALGLTLQLDKLDKHATTVFSGEIPRAIEFLDPEATFEDNVDSLRDFIIALDKEKADKLRYKVEDDVVRIFITPYKTKLSESDLEFSQGDFNVDAIVALGVVSKDDLDNAITAHGRILHDATVITVNAGGDMSNLGEINWSDEKASSIAEMLVSMEELMGGNLLDSQSSTAYLTGIVASTNRFSNDKTSAKVMNIAAQLMAAGANQQLIASNLRQDGVLTESINKPREDHAENEVQVDHSDHHKKKASDDDSDKDEPAEEPEPAKKIEHEKKDSDEKHDDSDDDESDEAGQTSDDLPKPPDFPPKPSDDEEPSFEMSDDLKKQLEDGDSKTDDTAKAEKKDSDEEADNKSSKEKKLEEKSEKPSLASEAAEPSGDVAPRGKTVEPPADDDDTVDKLKVEKPKETEIATAPMEVPVPASDDAATATDDSKKSDDDSKPEADEKPAEESTEVAAPAPAPAAPALPPADDTTADSTDESKEETTPAEAVPPAAIATPPSVPPADDGVLDEARKAVEQAVQGGDFSPANQPLESVGAQPLPAAEGDTVQDIMAQSEQATPPAAPMGQAPALPPLPAADNAPMTPPEVEKHPGANENAVSSSLLPVPSPDDGFQSGGFDEPAPAPMAANSFVADHHKPVIQPENASFASNGFAPAPATPQPTDGSLPPMPPLPQASSDGMMPPLPPVAAPGQDIIQPQLAPDTNPAFMQGMQASQNQWSQAADDLSAQNATADATRQAKMDEMTQQYDQAVDRNQELKGLPPINDPNGTGLPPLPPAPTV